MRVIAVSAETSLAAALNMMDGWEVVFAHDPEQIPTIAEGAAVLLAGGGTEEGLGLVAALRRVGVNVPAIVLGDRPPPEDASSIVLTPPFTLDELRSAVEHAIRVAPPPAPVAPVVPDERSMGALEAEAMENGSASVPMKDLREFSSAPPVPAPIANSRPARPADPPTPAAAEPLAEASASSDGDHEEQRTWEAPLEAAAAPIASAPMPARVEPQERGRRRRKKGREDDPTASAQGTAQPIAARLRAAEEAAHAVESVLADMPFLADVEMLSGALIGEVVEAFKPEVAVLYLPGAGGSFWVAGGHELTNAERRLKVKADHPLFRELFAAREPVLIAPLDLARALVAGVAGARTEALIASPCYSGSTVVGVIVVGRQDFSDGDLDTLARICTEAAPGLGVAEAIDRLRTFRA